MEASAIPRAVPLTAGRRALGGSLLRLRSDEQLVSLFRCGSEEAFTVIHERYRQRLFVYCRQMLSTSCQDAEDVLQDVFLRAYRSLRDDQRDVNLKAWLYRVAHNRCIDQLRRPTPPERDVFDVSRTPLHDPIVEAQRREDLRKLVEDVARLPEQQRSALLMREIDGLSYVDLAGALDVTVPAVKSLLVRARVGLAEAAEARDLDCATIRADLALAADKGVRASGRSKRHLRECAGCREYKVALKAQKAQFAALLPAGGLAPLALLAKLGLGGSSSAGAAAATSGGVIAGAGVATAGKVAAIVAAGALAAGGAVQVERHIVHRDATPAPAAHKADRPGAAAERATRAVAAPATAGAKDEHPVTRTAPAAKTRAKADDKHGSEVEATAPTGSTVTEEPAAGGEALPVVGSGSTPAVTAAPVVPSRGGTAGGGTSGSSSTGSTVDSTTGSTTTDTAPPGDGPPTADASSAPPGEGPPGP